MRILGNDNPQPLTATPSPARRSFFLLTMTALTIADFETLCRTNLARVHAALEGTTLSIDYPPLPFNKFISLPAKFPSNTLWRQSPGAILTRGTNLRDYSLAAWTGALTAIVAPTAGARGRFLEIYAAWGSSLFPPTTVDEMQRFPNCALLTFGGNQDPDLGPRSLAADFDLGFARRIKPAPVFTGHPVLFLWVITSSGPDAFDGPLFNVHFTGTITRSGPAIATY
jgi:hypothetical protein